MDERKAQERIHKAVRNSLSWLDELPSQETEILEQTKKEVNPLITVMNGNTETMIQPAFSPASHHIRARFRPVLALAAVLILIAGFWAVQHNGLVGNVTRDVVTQPGSNGETPGTPGMPAAVITDTINHPEELPLDRIDLYVEPDLLWNSETGILTEGENVDKKHLPYSNTVYRKMKDSGVKVDGELVYRSDEGAVLFKDQVKLCLDGDFCLDMPQKSFLIDAADGSFDFPLFNDRTATSYPSILLRNSGDDSMWTRIQDGMQHRLIERHTDAKLLTQAWRPVQVYLNDEYWGMYNMREPIDAHTICRYEQIPDEMAEDVTILSISGSHRIQGDNKAFKQMLTKIKNGNPAENPEDLEYLEQEVDIDNFLDWFTVEMYFGNSDIGGGKIYRVPGGKWKCLITDLDYAMYSSDFNSVKSYLKTKGMGEKGINNTIFLKILSVEKYKDLFFTKLGNLFRSLNADVMESEVDACVAWIEPGMKAHIDRWAPHYDKSILSDAPTTPEGGWEYWEQRIVRLRNVIRKRPTRLYNFIQEYFEMTDEEMAVYFPTDIPRTVDDQPYAY
ncbi:MAG: CotH kinase family protein [Clostridia bacterium]|nr:CotH kinase family protein [Clostridia bacterium]